MPRSLRLVFGWSLVAVLVGAPWEYARYRQQCFRNFRIVRPGMLYRSGQMNLAGLQRTIQDHHIRTIVNLRDGDAPEDQAEEAYCRSAGVNFHRLPYLPWWGSDGSVPAQENVDKFRAIVSDQSNWPILVHCFAGNHRTGAMCAIFRMDFDGWTNAHAIAEMKALGFTLIEDTPDLLEYLKAYRPQGQTFRPVSRHGD